MHVFLPVFLPLAALSARSPHFGSQQTPSSPTQVLFTLAEMVKFFGDNDIDEKERDRLLALGKHHSKYGRPGPSGSCALLGKIWNDLSNDRCLAGQGSLD